MLCQCKGHPYDCYDHPHDCGCVKALDRIGVLEKALDDAMSYLIVWAGSDDREAKKIIIACQAALLPGEKEQNQPKDSPATNGDREQDH